MKLLAGLGALGMLGGGLYATDSLTAGSVYDKPYAQAYAELETMSLLPITGAPGSGTGSTVVERGAGTIGWRIALGPVEVGRFTARLTPVGTDRTRVIVDFAATPVASSANPILTSELMANFARLAMVEQVDARMENRPPDMREIHWAAARHLQANPAQMAQFGDAIETQFRQVDEMLRAGDPADSADWEQRLRDIERNGARLPRTEDATRPTTDLSRFN